MSQEKEWEDALLSEEELDQVAGGRGLFLYYGEWGTVRIDGQDVEKMLFHLSYWLTMSDGTRVEKHMTLTEDEMWKLKKRHPDATFRRIPAPH